MIKQGQIWKSKIRDERVVILSESNTAKYPPLNSLGWEIGKLEVLEGRNKEEVTFLDVVTTREMTEYYEFTGENFDM